LDWSKGGIAAGWYIGLILIFTLLFVLQKYIHQGRDSALKDRHAIIAAQDGTGALEKGAAIAGTRIADEEVAVGGGAGAQDVKIRGDKAELVDIPLSDEKAEVEEKEVPVVMTAVSKQELN
jgi:hypothetical protein